MEITVEYAIVVEPSETGRGWKARVAGRERHGFGTEQLALRWCCRQLADMVRARDHVLEQKRSELCRLTVNYHFKARN